ncbi:MAG: hypothetical protein GF381_01060 [Candidatus Pacebacteria bacterium]|nr:hypothetical protein [Candidatus Paceibacterota bacterium]
MDLRKAAKLHTPLFLLFLVVVIFSFIFITKQKSRLSSCSINVFEFSSLDSAIQIGLADKKVFCQYLRLIEFNSERFWIGSDWTSPTKISFIATNQFKDEMTRNRLYLIDADTPYRASFTQINKSSGEATVEMYIDNSLYSNNSKDSLIKRYELLVLDILYERTHWQPEKSRNKVPNKKHFVEEIYNEKEHFLDVKLQ